MWPEACIGLLGRGTGLYGYSSSRSSGTQGSKSCKEVGVPLFPAQAFPFRNCHNCFQSPLLPGNALGLATRNEGRGQLPACPYPHCVPTGPPHLAVPLISDSLDLNLFPPHLLRGSSVLGRGGDRWMADLGTPHTVLMNGLGPVLSSWSAGHLLHSLLGR